MNKIAIIAVTERAIDQALAIQRQFPKSVVVSTKDHDNELVSTFSSIPVYLEKHFNKLDGICFVTAMGVCVRTIAPFIQDKNIDPAIVCVDDHGRNVQSVLSGHKGGGNEFTNKIAQVVGGNPIISTSSDLQNIWSLDTLGDKYGWSLESTVTLNQCIGLFVNNKKTALLLDIKDEGTSYLERELPSFVTVFYDESTIDYTEYELLIAVTYKIYESSIPSVFYRPKVLSLGSGCSKVLDFDLFEARLKQELIHNKISFLSIKDFGSIDIKGQQGAYLTLVEKYNLPFKTFTKEEIDTVSVPNPSSIVQEKIGVDGVSESSALLLSGSKSLLIEKQKNILDNTDKFTFSIALASANERKAEIAIIGAGPGDEDLITVKGKEYLQKADCVLYAGSLVPEEMTNWCKEGAVVRNSAMMTLEEQIDLMQEHYQKGNAIVRLHSGDPSIYGAIQEQMSIFDELGMDYFIVPGISSFNAAAAFLKSEFTIPEVVQTIIITRGEGKTPVPEAEKLSDMAKLKATLCLFLSVGIAKKVEGQLLEHYDPETPVAVLYRLTWKDQETWTGKLKDLAQIVKDSKKKRTVLIIVGDAIGARKNRSLLYSPDYKHIFRTNKKFVVKEG